MSFLSRTAIYRVSVCSFFGVILIARPQFLFGSPHSDQPMVDTPAERMISVTSEIYASLHIFISCCSAVRRLSPLLLLPVPVSLVYANVVPTFISVYSLRHTHPCNREPSTCNPLCHFFLFAKCAGLCNRVCTLLLPLALCVLGGDYCILVW